MLSHAPAPSGDVLHGNGGGVARPTAAELSTATAAAGVCGATQDPATCIDPQRVITTNPTRRPGVGG